MGRPKGPKNRPKTYEIPDVSGVYRRKLERPVPEIDKTLVALAIVAVAVTIALAVR